MATKAPVFDETYHDYLSRIANVDLAACQALLGFEIQEDEAIVPFINTTYGVSSRGVFDIRGKTPELSVCVVLFKYLLMCPKQIPRDNRLAAFKDFKDAGPLIQFFSNSVEGAVVHNFSGNVQGLDNACIRLGGEPYGQDLAYQVKYRFQGLPRVPIYLLFNDAEEGFSAQCSILLERRAEAFLDMESVAMIASRLTWLLASDQINKDSR